MSCRVSTSRLQKTKRPTVLEISVSTPCWGSPSRKGRSTFVWSTGPQLLFFSLFSFLFSSRMFSFGNSVGPRIFSSGSHIHVFGTRQFLLFSWVCLVRHLRDWSYPEYSFSIAGYVYPLLVRYLGNPRRALIRNCPCES